MIDKNVRNRAIKTTYIEYQGDINFIKDILLASDDLVSNDNITEDMIKKILYELDDDVFFSGLKWGFSDTEVRSELYQWFDSNNSQILNILNGT
ncbi:MULTISPECIES: hypothetical protein [Acinetobacter]|uniref:Uncharacterized protein n=1 Tax=Acinetobacter ursingii TaxID=108980 RepID=A0AA46NUC8_9GAMM|nr:MULTISPECIES: hypothetical protein [Acinetobacter]UYF77380.1 hypothetical protein LSO58_18260 [Acinetobacter ursingii]